MSSLTVQASHQYHQEVSRAGGESGGAERAAGRHGKARLAMEGAEESYRVAVEGVEEVRATWRRETEGCAGVFQVRTGSEAVEPEERFLLSTIFGLSSQTIRSPKSSETSHYH